MSSNKAFTTQIMKVDQWWDESQDKTLFRNYKHGFDNHMRVLFISAEIHTDSLNKGKDPNYQGISHANVSGTSPVDEPRQIIGKRLGGDGFPRNVFPCNSKLDQSVWKQDEEQVYSFLATGQNRHVLFSCALEYVDEFNENGEIPEISRPRKIHYHYKLHENNAFTGQVIEGIFDNISPAVTNPELVYRSYRV